MNHRSIAILFSAMVVILGSAVWPSRAADFALHDGDTVVFLGDSITAARTYGKIMENYTLLRYPERRVRFVNAGQGGDTAAGGSRRLEREVLAHNPTVLTVAYGINDIGWGIRADDEHKRQYLEGIRSIVEVCKRRGVRVFICSAAVTAADPSKSENDYLQKMCDEGMALSRSLGGDAIDVQRTMRGIQKRVWAANAAQTGKGEKSSLHAADGVHLNDLGQLAMAFAILKGLGAPSDVSSVQIDATIPKLVQSAGCTVTALKRDGQALEFVRLDQGLPLNNGLFFQLHFRFVPIPEELNRYLLTVTNLPPGQHEVLADGRSAGHFSAQQLSAGVNISSTTSDPWQPGGPWNAQANVLQSLTDARHNILNARFLSDYYLKTPAAPPPALAEANRADAQIQEMQRLAAKPRPYHFVVKPYVPPAKEQN